MINIIEIILLTFGECLERISSGNYKFNYKFPWLFENLFIWGFMSLSTLYRSYHDG